MCVRDSIMRNESPFASHLLYTQAGVLDDNIPVERKLGIEAGFAFKHLNNAITAFYVDYDWSRGMMQAKAYCMEHSLPFTVRVLGNEGEVEEFIFTYKGDRLISREIVVCNKQE